MVMILVRSQSMKRSLIQTFHPTWHPMLLQPAIHGTTQEMVSSRLTLVSGYLITDIMFAGTACDTILAYADIAIDAFYAWNVRFFQVYSDITS